MELEKKSRPTSVYALMVKFGTIVFAGILVCIIISNFSVFSPNWPFALFASFSGTFILILPFTLMFLLNRWRRAILPIVLLALFAFYPFYSFEEFVTPMEHDCIADECISVVAANLGYERKRTSYPMLGLTIFQFIWLFMRSKTGGLTESLRSFKIRICCCTQITQLQIPLRLGFEHGV